jgi:cell division protein FtsB
MQKIIFICLVLIVYLFNYQLRYGQGGYSNDDQLKRRIVAQQDINAKLEDRNSLMAIKITALKGSPAYLEARARMELGLVKANEILVHLPSNDSTDSMQSQIVQPIIKPVDVNQSDKLSSNKVVVQ